MNGFEHLKATLYLEDGSEFVGQLFGAVKSAVGEIVFQTGMVGYVESLTDPSYAKQFLTLTYPLIGNYGVPDPDLKDTFGLQDGFESEKVWPAALIVDRICPEGEHSHWQAVMSLSQWLKKSGVPGLAGIDVRLLTKKIREYGTMKAKLVIETEDKDAYDFIDIYQENIVATVSRKEPQVFGSGTLKIIAVDCGLKNNQVRCLAKRGCTVKVVPHNYDIDQENDFDGLFLSNGPGDPAKCTELISKISKILLRPNSKPVFGICLGNQLLARAIGATTSKLKYGNRGHNQPCTHLDTGRCFITSQNHGFAVDEETLSENWLPLFRNENDKTNEGIVHKEKPFFSVQFHPEHTAGPTDMEILFDVFIDAVKKNKTGEKFNVRQMIKDKLTFNSIYNIPEQRKVLVLGSGGLSIGQAGEFDYSGAQAIKALEEQKIRTVLINPNVATVQTTKGFADQTYFLPITKEYVTEVIKKERPTGILCTFGGQTGLNCAVDLYKDGTLDKYNVTVLGTPIQAIMNTEDRERFKEEIESIGEKVAPSRAATTVEDAASAAEEIGYPVLVRAAYALGGLGSGFASNREELIKICKTALAHSNQVLVDKSLRGWKELEYEVVRDAYDNCITVCNMENIDPVGIHTGESVVVAPSQTLNDREYNALRETAIKVIRHFGIIGECNIQYALNPHSLEYYIIEVNARLSRSSALASKATGYPLAYIAAKLALGEKLPVLRNSVTGKTTACFEPSLDYCVVKIPRWDLSKFARVSTRIGSSMKSVGEVMGIGRSFEEAFQKALRMVNEYYDGFSPFLFTRETIDDDLANPTDKRMLALARSLFYQEHTIERIHELTQIDLWFLHRMNHIIEIYRKVEYIYKHLKGQKITRELLLEAKQSGFSDAQIAKCIQKLGEIGATEGGIRELRKSFTPPITPYVKQIDTVAAEWPAVTNYLYLTYNGAEHDIEFNKAEKSNSVIVLGSGVYRIGSSVEFDACCVGCVKELKVLGYKAITINCNPETVSTDYDVCDRLYFEEISFEIVVDIYEIERPKGLILGFGGQAPNNIAMSLYRAKFSPEVVPDGRITMFGTSPKNIDDAEDRYKFSRALDELKIDQPRWKRADKKEDAEKFCEEVGYPCLIRPSYVLSGAAMNVAHNEQDLENFLKQATIVSKNHPVVVSKFIEEAKEIDVDVVAMRMGSNRISKVVAMAISEHVENAGIHSGDATLVTPPQDLNEKTLKGIKEIAEKIAAKLEVNGPFNMQLIAKNDNLYVIECNLRASRSFPFISKTLDFDFVALATRVMMSVDNPQLKESIKPVNIVFGKPGATKKVGVKVSQFSFSRLAGADVIMGVEMVSTGEVGCFGKDRHEAYLKGLLSTGFVIPKKTVFLSVGGVNPKIEMEESVKNLEEMGYELYGSKGTADYYQQRNIKIKAVDWPFEEGASDGSSSTEKTASAAKNVSDFLANKDFHLMINLPIRGSGAYRVSAYRTHGYKTRRMAIDNGIPLITDIKCSKLFVKALMATRRAKLERPPVNTQIDCISSHTLKRLPGFIDVHVHFREPGGEHKETWETGSRAAIAGGITLVLAMPNTNPPLVDQETFEKVEKKASQKSIADYALYAGATPHNVEELKHFAQKCAGLKMYLNETFATLKMPSMTDWIQHFKNFPENRPIVCHAEKQTLAAILAVSQLTGRAVHIAHVSTEEEIEMVREAKQKGWQVTCEVCPHHLFLTVDDLPEGWREVRPRLATKRDVDALWKNMEYIDCFATDHAPHTQEEKSSQNPPPGFPGVEYMLPLLLTSIYEGRLTMNQLVDKLYNNPRKIFNLPEQPNTYIEVDLSEEWVIPQNGGESKAQWTPFAGKSVRGKVRTVVIRGEEVFVDGNFVAQPGFGKNVRLLEEKARLPSEEPEMGYKAQIALRQHLQDDFNAQRRGSIQSWRNGESPRISPTRAIITKDKWWFKKSVIKIDHNTINKEMISQLFELANYIRQDLDMAVPTCVFKRHFVMASMFYEVSTRTKCSFGTAMKRLGGVVEEMDAQTSSVKKGETLEDSVIMMSGYADVILLRHPEIGAAERAKQVAKCPVINGGDGTGEHPTQALLDLFTIRDEIGHVNKITIALVGDLKHGRTVHSLAKILCNYEEITIRYVAPTKELGIPQEVYEYVERHGVRFKQEKFYDLDEGIRQADVIYMTRIQQERFINREEYEAVRGKFKLTPKLLNQCRLDIEEHNVYNIQGMKKLPIVMHPLPRNEEISVEVDTDERAAYFRQAENGMYVRMALLALVLGVDFD